MATAASPQRKPMRIGCVSQQSQTDHCCAAIYSVRDDRIEETEPFPLKPKLGLNGPLTHQINLHCSHRRSRRDSRLGCPAKRSAANGDFPKGCPYCPPAFLNAGLLASPVSSDFTDWGVSGEASKYSM